MTLAYFWSENGNFGDLLTPLLLEHFCGVTPMVSTPEIADVVVAGSVLDVIPDGWGGIVAGAGKLHEETQTDLTNATVLGLRGHLTASAVRLAPSASPVIGDPGLLAAELAPANPGQYALGVVPHWSDTELFDKFAYLKPVLIEPTGNPLTIISMIGSCSMIVTSSLHGLVVADSFGIPRRAERFPNMVTNPHEGSDFKFRDYSSALGQPVEFGKLGGQLAPLGRVEKLKHDLFDMFHMLTSLLP
jgi:pyruvyltransferase